ncbi:MAG: hypothetical protein H7144_05335 [Burkholderiales bacterium]|nr:hypothetical protein [Phycisphaerae bacterium]
MMAKMFYTLDETKQTLGKSDEEIKQLTREGRLREFRDGPRLMFKADQVDVLKTEIASGGDQINLGMSDTGAPIGLIDSRSGSSPVISLTDSEGARPSPASLKEDTALAADLGLSGSIGLSGSVGGMPSPRMGGSGMAMPAAGNTGSGSGLSGLSGSMSGSGAGGSLAGGSMAGGSMAGGSLAGGSMAGSMSGSRSGINLLGDDADADPMAQTAVNPAIADQLNIEGMGSGSGLLDLTRESDNTSLGAVLDEIPGGSRAGATRSGETVTSSAAGGSAGLSAVSLSHSSSRIITPPTYVEARDAMAPAIGGMALMASLFALVGILALAGGVLNTRSGLIQNFTEMSMIIVAGIGLGAVLVGFVGGLIIGKVR